MCRIRPPAFRFRLFESYLAFSLFVQLCENIAEREKAQTMPHFPAGWGFYFVSDVASSDIKSGTSESKQLVVLANVYPHLRGLRIAVRKRGNVIESYTHLALIARGCGYSLDTLLSKLDQFSIETLGIDKLETPDHKLLHKRVFQTWTDVAGRTRSAFGTITGCFKKIKDSAKVFSIEYCNKHLAVQPENLGIHEDFLAMIENVPESIAWGAAFHYANITGLLDESFFSDSPVYYQWVIPQFRNVDAGGQLIMELRGFRLVFSVQKSNVEGAGLGLMLTVSDMTFEGRMNFVLKLGEMIDLGPYAPMCDHDRRPSHIHIVKCFIHNWKNDSYSFDANGKNHETYDVTNDKTGELHEHALKNPLIRVNETDGTDIPSIVAETVPNGGVNYYLGHNLSGQGDLQLPVGESIELKVSRLGIQFLEQFNDVTLPACLLLIFRPMCRLTTEKRMRSFV